MRLAEGLHTQKGIATDGDGQSCRAISHELPHARDVLRQSVVAEVHRGELRKRSSRGDGPPYPRPRNGAAEQVTIQRERRQKRQSRPFTRQQTCEIVRLQLKIPHFGHVCPFPREGACQLDRLQVEAQHHHHRCPLGRKGALLAYFARRTRVASIQALAAPGDMRFRLLGLIWHEHVSREME